MARKVKILKNISESLLENDIQKFLDINTEAELISISYSIVATKGEYTTSYSRDIRMTNYTHAALIIYRTEE